MDAESGYLAAAVRVATVVVEKEFYLFAEAKKICLHGCIIGVVGNSVVSNDDDCRQDTNNDNNNYKFDNRKTGVSRRGIDSIDAHAAIVA